MPILIRNVHLELDEPEELLLDRVAARLRVVRHAIRNHAIIRRSVDARWGRVRFSYHLEIALDESPALERKRLTRLHRADVTWIESKPASEPEIGQEALFHRPMIVGFGPAGMFAAYRLAVHGYKPIVLERGREVRRRHRDILERFYRQRDFDPSSNLLFGEGGAGTYSDGKLYTRLSDPLCKTILEILYAHGAAPDILIDARPHVGSDRLPTITTRIRQKIESLGGQILFEREVNDLRIVEDRKVEPDARTVTALRVNDEWLDVGPIILAIGHSARDTIRLLVQRGLAIRPKPFQIGVRIEHPQEMVDKWQYGSSAGHNRLQPAEYYLVAKQAAGELGNVFSFCMCPGGMILPTNESPNLIVTNGASRASRAGPFANSGLVITMDADRWDGDAMKALEFQKSWEELAFKATGETYKVPVQRACDFLATSPSSGRLETSFPLGGQWADIRSIVPPELAGALERALPKLDSKLPGFAGKEALITAPETRASSPVRVLRDRTTRRAEGISNLYPVGEGAGYAGGIVSAAVDGIKAADKIIAQYAPPR